MWKGSRLAGTDSLPWSKARAKEWRQESQGEVVFDSGNKAMVCGSHSSGL
jgi:hypothetical protein